MPERTGDHNGESRGQDRHGIAPSHATAGVTMGPAVMVRPDRQRHVLVVLARSAPSPRQRCRLLDLYARDLNAT
jgi:hypothetical protein